MDNKIWNQLLEFETRDLVEDYVRAHFDRTMSEKQVIDVTSHFRQGREYFRNASSADVSVKPLLQYYGVASLTKGLILLCAPHFDDDTSKPGHGLTVQDWRAIINKKQFTDLKVVITEGTFYSLLQVTENRSFFKHHTNQFEWPTDFDVPPKGSMIGFAKLIGTFPDFQHEYKLWTKTSMPIFRISGIAHPNEEEVLYSGYPSSTSTDVIDQIFPQKVFNTKNPAIIKGVVSVVVNNIVPQVSQIYKDTSGMGFGQIAITQYIEENVRLSMLSQAYCLSYFLGMLARYFPAAWITMGRTSKGDAIYPLINVCLDFIDNHFPELVVSFLKLAHQNK